MNANALQVPEKQGKPPEWRPDWETRFKPGVSGNPGGVKKGTVFVSECYKRLIALPLEELQAFQPSNAAEAAALRQVYTSMYGFDALPALKEITDRTEGKAPNRIHVTGEVTVSHQVEAFESIVTQLAEKHGLTEEEVRERMLSQRPELKQLLELNT